MTEPTRTDASSKFSKDHWLPEVDPNFTDANTRYASNREVADRAYQSLGRAKINHSGERSCKKSVKEAERDLKDGEDECSIKRSVLAIHTFQKADFDYPHTEEHLTAERTYRDSVKNASATAQWWSGVGAQCNEHGEKEQAKAAKKIREDTNAEADARYAHAYSLVRGTPVTARDASFLSKGKLGSLFSTKSKTSSANASG